MLHIYRHPLHLLYLTAGVIFSYVFFISLMNEGQPKKLSIAIVDNDASVVSRELCHNLESMPGVSVKNVYNNHTEARKALQKQEIYAFLEIPDGTNQKVQALQAPTIHIYLDQTHVLTGSLSFQSLLTMCNMAAGAAQREILRMKGYTDEAIMGLIQPITLDTHKIGNPLANYSSYLLTTLLPGILGLQVLLLTIYVIGSEQKRSTSYDWLATAGDNIVVALLGKLLPYTIWFLLLQEIGMLVLFAGLEFPMNGSFLTLLTSSLLYVLAMQGMGVALVALIPELRTSISFGTFLGVWGFSLSGFTYPATNMLGPAQAITYLFPLRHYYLIYVNEAIFGGGFWQSVPYMMFLLCFVLLPVPVLKRLNTNILLPNSESRGLAPVLPEANYSEAPSPGASIPDSVPDTK